MVGKNDIDLFYRDKNNLLNSKNKFIEMFLYLNSPVTYRSRSLNTNIDVLNTLIA